MYDPSLILSPCRMFLDTHSSSRSARSQFGDENRLEQRPTGHVSRRSEWRPQRQYLRPSEHLESKKVGALYSKTNLSGLRTESSEVCAFSNVLGMAFLLSYSVTNRYTNSSGSSDIRKPGPRPSPVFLLTTSGLQQSIWAPKVILPLFLLFIRHI